MKGYNVAIVGATGLVGQELIRVLEQRRFPVSAIHLFGSDRSAGRKLFVNHKEMEVKETANNSFERIDIALFSAREEASLYYSPIAVQSGAIVIDNSSAFRAEPDVPLVVPEVNPEDAKRHKGIIASPDSATIQLAVVLYPLHRVNPIKRIIMDTYQSVSGTGAAGMEELTNQTKLVLEGRNATPHVYPHQIAFNVLPEVDVFLDNGYTREEWKIIEETKKVMHAANIAISATCVRVPVYLGYAEAVHVEFTHAITPEEAQHILADAPGVKIQDDPTISLYPQPWSAQGSEDVFVGRLRRDVSINNGLAMWIVTDNLRKGAAVNAIQIAELMVQQGLL